MTPTSAPPIPSIPSVSCPSSPGPVSELSQQHMQQHAQQQSRKRGNDAGAATVFVVAFAVVLLVLAGLVVDGGLAINARQQVTDDVEQAARAGSQQLNLATLRDGGIVEIDAPLAREAAARFLVKRGYPAAGIQVSATNQQVTASATIQRKTALLSLIFIDHFTVTAHGQARPAVGITGEVTP
jgi:Flp pilus assembly protein TadG